MREESGEKICLPGLQSRKDGQDKDLLVCKSWVVSVTFSAELNGTN